MCENHKGGSYGFIVFTSSFEMMWAADQKRCNYMDILTQHDTPYTSDYYPSISQSEQTLFCAGWGSGTSMFPRNGGAFVGTRLSELLVVLKGCQKGGWLMVIQLYMLQLRQTYQTLQGLRVLVPNDNLHLLMFFPVIAQPKYHRPFLEVSFCWYSNLRWVGSNRLFFQNGWRNNAQTGLWNVPYGWCFQIFYIWGRLPFWRASFSNALVQHVGGNHQGNPQPHSPDFGEIRKLIVGFHMNETMVCKNRWWVWTNYNL